MGAGASIDDNGSNQYVLRDDINVETKEEKSEITNDKNQALALQAQSHWHKMIMFANQNGNMANSNLSLDVAVEEEHKIPHDYVENESIPLVPKLTRRPTIKEMALQFKYEEIEKQKSSDMLRDVFEASNSSKNNSPYKGSPIIKPSKSQNTLIKQQKSQMNFALLQSLPSLRIQLISRTGSSIEITWDVDVESVSCLRSLTNADNNIFQMTYEIRYRKLPLYDKNIMISNLYLPTKNKAGSKNYDEGDDVDKEFKWKQVYLDYTYDTPDFDSSTRNDITPSTIGRTPKNTTTVDYLDPDTQYAFCGRRIDINISSMINFDSWSPHETIIRTGPGTPPSPKNLHSTEISSSTILLSWSNPERDNGLPILSYVLRMKMLGSEFKEVYFGKDRLYFATNLLPNVVYVFDVCSVNAMGCGAFTARYAVRTLQEGAASITPWSEAIDENTNRLVYVHPKSKVVASALPEGSLVDNNASFKNKTNYLYKKLKEMAKSSIAKLQEQADDVGYSDQLQNGNYAYKVTLCRESILEGSLRCLHRLRNESLTAGPLRISFSGEEGVDGGGIVREWAVALSQRVIEPCAGLFSVGENGK